MRNVCATAFALLLVAVARPAFADATAFVGSNRGSEGGSVRGAALGISGRVIGFEFEYAETRPERPGAGPAVRSGMINLLVQAPRRITGVQLYASLGAGLYQERGGPTAATNVASGAGGGIRIPLLGPFGLRVDYRVFSLRGSGLDPPLQRIYAGVNLAF